MAEVEFEVRDGVAVITINRPEAKNTVTRAVSEAIAASLDEIAARDDIRVGVITGADGTFCAGMDLKAFLRGEKVRLEGRGFAGITQSDLPKPMIAAVEGYALGGGFEIVLACDMTVAARDARFGCPEVKRGLVANAGGLVRLPRQMPPRIATQLILTGDMVTAEYLDRFGMINELTDPGGALEAAIALASRIAQNGPLAIAASRDVMRKQQDWPTAELFERQFESTLPIFASDDAKEGAKAFAEKRQPRWAGR